MAPFLRLFTYKTRRRPEYCTLSARKKAGKCIFLKKSENPFVSLCLMAIDRLSFPNEKGALPCGKAPLWSGCNCFIIQLPGRLPYSVCCSNILKSGSRGFRCLPHG